MVLVVKKKRTLAQKIASSGASNFEQSPNRPVLNTKQVPCILSCPNELPIREFIRIIAETEDLKANYNQSFYDAFDLITERNPFPSVIGRVCPHPCESECNRQFKENSLGICNIERFIGDFALEQNIPLKRINSNIYKERIAIIGSGPAGLSCAYQLARYGYKPTIYEEKDKLGGLLRYGIPDFRLPKNVLDKEIERIINLGIEVHTNTKLSKDISIKELQNNYDAIFIAIGCYNPVYLDLPNSQADNTISAIDFMYNINIGNSINLAENVIVVGDGDTAIDVARVSKRMGANVILLRRFKGNHLPAIEQEIKQAEQENITIYYYCSPKDFIIENNKIVKLIVQKLEPIDNCIKTEFIPIPIPNDTFTLDCSYIIWALSQTPKYNELKEILIDDNKINIDSNYKTDNDKIYVAGDIISLSLVTNAVYQGRKVAEAIHSKFRNLEIDKSEKNDFVVADKTKIVFSFYKEHNRNQEKILDAFDRTKSLNIEYTSTYTQEQVIDEAKRCMSCGKCFDCATCWSLCQEQSIIKPINKFGEYKFKLELCKGCNKCAESCPCGIIDMIDAFTGTIAQINKVL